MAGVVADALTRALEEKSSGGAHPDLTAIVADARFSVAKITTARDLLVKWGAEHDYAAAAGINLDDDSLNVPAAEAEAARATSIFNAWLVRAIQRTFGDELARVGLSGVGTSNTGRGFVRLMTLPPAQLATYDASTGESALWDDIDTAEVESKDQRIVLAMLDAFASLEQSFGSADDTTWRWGALHRVVFDPQVPLWPIRIPNNTTGPFAKGFPRHGDQWNVDASNPGISRALSSALDFTFGSGPTQRFVAELTPEGPIIRNALPGGAQMFKDSPWFANEAELWRRNQTHRVPFSDAEVAADATTPGGQHTLYR